MGAILLKNINTGGGNADILIDGGVIRKISPAMGMMPGNGCAAGSADSRPSVSGCGDVPHAADMACETVDCTGKAAVPGFMNMHTHAAMSLMRGMGEDVAFHRWLERIWEMESMEDEEYVYWGTKVACVEMLRTGTTTFNDHYWFPDSAHKAAEELGIRPVISYVLLDKHDAEEALRQQDACTALYERSLGWGGQPAFTVGIHSIYSVSEKCMLWAADFARKHGLKIHIHVSETQKEVTDCMRDHGCSPVQYLERLGLLGPDVIAAHTLWISDEDVELLGRYGVNCVHNINSNLKLASGYRFRYNELRDAGANVCIGTDGCASSNNLDIPEALKTAAMVQKAWRGDPSAMPLGELIDMATVNGAKALGMNTGRLEEGMDADILVVNTDNTFFLSPGSFLANFIYSAHSDCIESVICKGRFVMRDRIVPGEAEILAEARRVIGKIS